MCLVPFVVVAGLASGWPEGPSEGTLNDCDDCVNGKKAAPGTDPDYETTCYPATGLPPLLKRSSCYACLQELCGAACADTHSIAKCGI